MHNALRRTACGPAPALTAPHIPVLALFGSLDTQVVAADNEGPMKAALQGNPAGEVVTPAGLKHLFQPALARAVQEYGDIETTIDPAALEQIVGWTQQQVGLSLPAPIRGPR